MHDRALGGLRRSCSTAAMLFKRVAEASMPMHAVLRAAYRNYEDGDYEVCTSSYLFFIPETEKGFLKYCLCHVVQARGRSERPTGTN